MKCKQLWPLALLAMFLIASSTHVSQFSVVAQEPDEQEVEEAEIRFRELQQRIEEIEQEIEAAEREGNEEVIDALREEAEKVFDRLDALNREFGFDEEEEGEFESEEREELERHLRNLEIERAELEASFGRLEMVQRLAAISSDAEDTAAYAILTINEYMEWDESIEFLNETLEQTTNPDIIRLIRIKLAELYRFTDNPEAAKEQLRALIRGE